ncbi:uncharacterized protein LOC104858342 [Fukomys damarensis]|uniref:uncharacterized protein LOC104858342 n=1 Tax=Fukomys damarensis TaxID=885580 RepID=UPI0014558E73|nr:uncharacterized protein LOC104858342 [Fukomys damarensis]
MVLLAWTGLEGSRDLNKVHPVSGTWFAAPMKAPGQGGSQIGRLPPSPLSRGQGLWDGVWGVRACDCGWAELRQPSSHSQGAGPQGPWGIHTAARVSEGLQVAPNTKSQEGPMGKAAHSTFSLVHPALLWTPRSSLNSGSPQEKYLREAAALRCWLTSSEHSARARNRGRDQERGPLSSACIFWGPVVIELPAPSWRAVPCCAPCPVCLRP